MLNHELAQRLWARVSRGGPNSCWLWTGYTRPDGYGEMGIPKTRRTILTHRAAWIVTNGPLPELAGFHGAVVMHTCDVPACCNPAHLIVGTQKENIADCHAKKRGDSPLGQRHPWGHPHSHHLGVLRVRLSTRPQRKIPPG